MGDEIMPFTIDCGECAICAEAKPVVRSGHRRTKPTNPSVSIGICETCLNDYIAAMML